VDAVCTRAIIICNGELIANGSPAELKAKSRLHGAVEVSFRALNQDILAKIKKLSSAGETNTDDNTVTICPRDAGRLFQEMTDLARSNPDWPITGLRTLEGKLDDVFRELTGGR